MSFIVSHSDGQVVSVTHCSVNDSSSFPTRDSACRFSVQCKVIELSLSRMPFTGPTEFIISIVNSVKMVNIPLARLPHLEEGKSLCILLSLYYEFLSPIVTLHRVFRRTLVCESIRFFILLNTVFLFNTVSSNVQF